MIHNLNYWFTRQTQDIFRDFGCDPERYIHIDNGSCILAVCHLDTVELVGRSAPILTPLSITATGTDDRLGAWVINEVLPDLGINVDILMTNYEETGKSTAALFEMKDKYNWVVEFDRKGEDVVTYGIDSPIFLEAIKAEGFTVGHGSFSDICELDTKVCAMNVGIGYENGHAADSTVSIPVLERQLIRFKAFYDAFRQKAFLYTEKPKTTFVSRRVASKWYGKYEGVQEISKTSGFPTTDEMVADDNKTLNRKIIDFGLRNKDAQVSHTAAVFQSMTKCTSCGGPLITDREYDLGVCHTCLSTVGGSWEHSRLCDYCGELIDLSVYPTEIEAHLGLGVCAKCLWEQYGIFISRKTFRTMCFYDAARQEVLVPAISSFWQDGVWVSRYV